jgi:hypothetical protein
MCRLHSRVPPELKIGSHPILFLPVARLSQITGEFTRSPPPSFLDESLHIPASLATVSSST